MVYDSYSADIENLSKQVEALQYQLFQFTKDQPFVPNEWLTPKQFCPLIGYKPVTLAKWRRAKRFRNISVKAQANGQNTNYYFHRKFAMEDIAKFRPISLKVEA